MTTFNIDPEALVAAAVKIQREWGHSGYRIEAVTGASCGAVLLTVRAHDGGRFHVGATCYGNTVHHDEIGPATAALRARIAEDNRP